MTEGLFHFRQQVLAANAIFRVDIDGGAAPNRFDNLQNSFTNRDPMTDEVGFFNGVSRFSA